MTSWVGRWALYFGLRPDLGCSIGNVCTSVKRLGVLTRTRFAVEESSESGFTGLWDLQDWGLRRDWADSEIGDRHFEASQRLRKRRPDAFTWGGTGGYADYVPRTSQRSYRAAMDRAAMVNGTVTRNPEGGLEAWVAVSVMDVHGEPQECDVIGTASPPAATWSGLTTTKLGWCSTDAVAGCRFPVRRPAPPRHGTARGQPRHHGRQRGRRRNHRRNRSLASALPWTQPVALASQVV